MHASASCTAMHTSLSLATRTLKFLQLYSDFVNAPISCPTGKEVSTVCELRALEVAWQAFHRTYTAGGVDDASHV